VDDYLFSESAFGASGADALPTGSSSGADALPTGSSSGAPKALTLGDLFVVLGSKRTSSKGRKKEAEAIKAAAAAAAAEKAAAEAARLAELRRRYDLQQQQPKSVKCALCNKSKTVGDAIAWQKHPLGFTNQPICAECYVPPPSSPKLVWKYGGTKSKSKSKRSKSRSRSKSKRSRSKSRSRSRF